MRITIVLPGGSSPLTRGKLHLAALTGADARLIPAHAGKTFRALARVKRLRAHPRSRGENQRGGVLALPAVGSSPITREKDVHAEASIRFEGSSPLTRGKPVARCSVSGGGWLIPTHAGKTLRGSRPPAGSRAHPHSHGENSASMRLKATRQGSSPLTWGKQIPAQAQRAGHGFIPAHAGKTCGGLSVRAWRGAHPRSRGENCVSHFGVSFCVGSSPLTRGKR